MNDLKPTDQLLPSGRVVRDGVEYGCHCDIASDYEADGCVIETSDYDDCIFAKINGRNRRSRWTCSEWKKVRA